MKLNTIAMLGLATSFVGPAKYGSYKMKSTPVSNYAQVQKQAATDAKRSRKNAIRYKNNVQCIVNNLATKPKYYTF